MTIRKLYPGMLRYLRLPGSIQGEIALYYLKRMIRIKPTDHQAIWTSFLYYTMRTSVWINKQDDLYRITASVGGRQLDSFIRGQHSSDIFVFFQVFIAQGYKPLIDFLNRYAVKPKVVIDAGANVGYFSLLVMSHYKPDVLIALEPEKNNYHQLKKNVTFNDFKVDARLWQSALWTHNTRISIKSEQGKEWATTITETETNQACEALSLSDIITRAQVETIDILKIDIEGTENALFKNKDFLLMLNKVKVLGMEIHDHLADRKEIHKALSDHSFLFFETGELTVAWNSKFIDAQ